jgi:hypothetical protein
MTQAVRCRRVTNESEVYMSQDWIEGLWNSSVHPEGGIEIDDEFRNLIPAITDEERKQLEENVVAFGGARDPLTIWVRGDDDLVLLDGHNRYEICKRLGLPFLYTLVHFDTRDEAADWIDRNQLGRRNLSRQDYKLLLGRRYSRATRQGKRTDLTSGKSCPKSERTSERLAKEHGVTEKTVRNAAKYQKAAETLGIEKDIAAGKVKAPESAVIEAAAALPRNPTPAQVEQSRESLPKGKRSKGKAPSPPTSGESRAKNQRLAQKITVELIRLRDNVETLAETDSAYRQEALRELQSCIGHLSRAKATAPVSAGEHQPDDGLRAAVAKRWQVMRLWEKHWSIADMKDVRRMFMELIRDEQKQLGK